MISTQYGEEGKHARLLYLLGNVTGRMWLGQTWSDVDDRVINFAPYVSELLNWDYLRAPFRSAEYECNDGGGFGRSSNGLSFLQVYDAGGAVRSAEASVGSCILFKHIKLFSLQPSVDGTSK